MPLAKRISHPWGRRVDRSITHLMLRPFQTAQTYHNLKATGCGVFHVTDDVNLLARARRSAGWNHCLHSSRSEQFSLPAAGGRLPLVCLSGPVPRRFGRANDD